MKKSFAYTKGKILLLMLLTTILLVSLNKVDVTAASPDTYIYVDPSEVRDVMPGGPPPTDRFFVNISVTEAPEAYAWEIFLSWDPALLDLAVVNEGNFLHRGMYLTDLLYFPSLDDANVDGEIMIGCSLSGDVPWASGDGWLCELGFIVEDTGSCVLNIFETRLWDHLEAGLPAHTYYQNLDGFFYNVGIHDIAITSVTASLVAEIATINVTVKNEGNFTETFNVNVYADATVYNTTVEWWIEEIIVGDEITVGTQPVTNLAIGATTTLTFTWDTTEEAGGNYTISAEVTGDDDTRDNLFIDGSVTVAVHDIAITNVVPSPGKVTVGDNVTIEVTVENEGHFNETFDVAVYYDNTVIEVKNVTDLLSGSTTTLTFIWDTTLVEEGTYNITAKVPPVPEEEDIGDNTFTFDGTVKVRGEAAVDIILYVAVGIVIIIAAAVAVYFIKFRKPK